MTPSRRWPTKRLLRLKAVLDEHDDAILDLHVMPDTGLAHDHLWITRHHGDDRVARIPKQSQMQLDPQANLAYQAACFRRAAPCGHMPRLHAVLPISELLPRGGLLVEAIPGQTAQLPDDLTAIATALARLHELPLPASDERTPLIHEASPWNAMRDEVLTQARYLDRAPITAATRQRITRELTLFDTPGLAARIDAQRCLISFDAHPGNILITPEGRAVLVDLEKCRYSHPGFDLAHATLYTSTTWDPGSHAVLDNHQVAGFYRDWWQARRQGDSTMDITALIATRRAMWLWSVTWCAKWLTLHRAEQDARASGEDWSASLSDDALIAHVADRTAHYLDEPTVMQVADDHQRLAERLQDESCHACHDGTRRITPESP